jgi:DNA-binding XRE family transcriptional regulator
MKAESVHKQLHKKLKDLNFKVRYEIDRQKLEIVKRVIDYRIKNSVSQKQLADNVGITQQHISKIESGKFSSIETLQKVLFCIGYTVRIHAVPLNRGLK